MLLGLALLTLGWENLNPGGGGQVQDIVPDPNVAGRVFLVSDMEGIYRSDDSGQSWKFAGDGLIHGRAFSLAIDPKDSRTVYVGTLAGLHVSRDGGLTFRLVKASRLRSIGAITIQGRTVVAAEGWTDDDDFDGLFRNMTNRKTQVLVSRDRGGTWAWVPARGGDPTRAANILTAATEGGRIVLGGSQGVFESTDGARTFRAVASPIGVGPNRGVAVADDLVLAAFGPSSGDGPSRLFVLRGPAWTELSVPASLRFWRPTFRREPGRVTMLLPTQSEREGLYEGTLDLTANKVTWRKVFAGVEGYDVGWDYAPPNPRFAHFDRDGRIWTTANQNAFLGTKQGDRWTWTNRYSIEHPAQRIWNRFSTYGSRGWASTFTYDVAAHGRYAIQGQGDNGWVESWDGGVSWANIQRHADGMSVSDSQAVAIGDAWGTPVVLAHGSAGYGGAASGGALFGKLLETSSPTDRWESIGGGPKWKGGLPEGVVREIAIAPSERGTAALAVANHGLYRIGDLGWYVRHINTDGQAGVEAITTDEWAKNVRGLAFDPQKPDILYATAFGADPGLHRLERTPQGTWTHEKILSGLTWESRVAVWTALGTDWTAVTQEDRLLLRQGTGAFRPIFSLKDALKLRKPPPWFAEIRDEYRPKATGLAADGTTLIVGLYDHRFQRGYGVFRGTLAKDGTVTWRDWTEGMAFPGLTDARIVDGAYWSGTAGTGAWRRRL